MASRKVPGGKLVQVHLEHDGSAITEAVITGDFFVHPEEGLSDLERGLRGILIGEKEEGIAHRLETIVSERGLALVGFSPADLAALVKEALR